MKIRLPKLNLKWFDINRVGRIGLALNTLISLILVNFIVSFFPGKIDLTQNQEFTLSRTTHEIIGKLNDLVTIKAFLSENLPPRYLPIKQKIKDTLYEYEKASNGKIRVNYLDPKNDPSLINQALNLGIPALSVPDFQNDKFSLSRVFLGLVVSFADRKSVIAQVDPGTNLEHDLSTTIRKVSRQEEIKLTLTYGHGEDTATPNNLLRELLEKDFNLSELNLSEDKDQELIETSQSILLMVNPTEKFGARAQLILDQFLMKGGSLILLANPVTVSSNLQPSLNQTNISTLLEHYGLKLNQDLILSAENEIASFSTGYTNFVTPYPFWIRIPTSGFDRSQPALARLETAVFPWASSIGLDRGKVLSEVNFSELVKTAKQSFSQTQNFNIDPTQAIQSPEGELVEKTIAVLASGPLTSAIKNDPKLRQAALSGEDLRETAEKSTKLALFGDSDFVSDYFIRGYESNTALLLNLIESFSGQSGLAEIRSKSFNVRPLKALPENAKIWIKWLNVLGLPTLVTLAGLVRFLRRSR